MKFLTRSSLLTVLLLAGCGSPLAGSWQEQGADAWSIDMSAEGKFMVHGEGPDGSHDHDHCSGTWTMEGDNLTLKGSWDHARQDVQWTGTLKDGVLELVVEQGKEPRRFRKG